MDERLRTEYTEVTLSDECPVHIGQKVTFEEKEWEVTDLTSYDGRLYYIKIERIENDRTARRVLRWTKEKGFWESR